MNKPGTFRLLVTVLALAGFTVTIRNSAHHQIDQSRQEDEMDLVASKISSEVGVIFDQDADWDEKDRSLLLRRSRGRSTHGSFMICGDINGIFKFCIKKRQNCIIGPDDVTCECKAGLTGNRCMEPVNECVEDYPCPGEQGKESFCVDAFFPENYRCGCLKGYEPVFPTDWTDPWVEVQYRPLACVPKPTTPPTTAVPIPTSAPTLVPTISPVARESGTCATSSDCQGFLQNNFQCSISGTCICLPGFIRVANTCQELLDTNGTTTTTTTTTAVPPLTTTTNEGTTSTTTTTTSIPFVTTTNGETSTTSTTTTFTTSEPETSTTTTTTTTNSENGPETSTTTAASTTTTDNTPESTSTTTSTTTSSESTTSVPETSTTTSTSENGPETSTTTAASTTTTDNTPESTSSTTSTTTSSESTTSVAETSTTTSTLENAPETSTTTAASTTTTDNTPESTSTNTTPSPETTTTGATTTSTTTTPPTSFVCPSAVGDAGSISIQYGGEIDFAIADSDRLCTLVQVAAEGSTFKPVGRSYDGYPWEPAAGEFSVTEFSCSDGVCTVSLPAPPAGSQFYLTSFDIPEQYPGGQDTVARFLEQATFGPTLDLVKSFGSDDSTAAFANWIRDQQNSVPLTSHRAFFRQHMNAYSSVATMQGRVTHPCQKGARYRRYTFNQKDENSFVTVKSIEGTDKKVLIINGFARSVVNGPIRRIGKDSVTFPDGTYKIIWLSNRMNVIGGDIWFTHPTDIFTPVSFNGVSGNPPLEFDSGITPNILFDVPLGGAKYIDSFYYELESEPEQEFILTADITGSTCDSLDEPGNPLNPVFALYNGKYWMHDPRFETFDNTVESPAIDGGGTVFRETANIIKPERAAVCANVPRTFLNEDSCKFSMEPTTCSVGTRTYEWQAFTGDLPDFYLDLTPENIRAIYDVTSSSGPGEARYLYAVEGLRMSDDQKVALPCTFMAKSRWKKIKCTGAAASVDPELHRIFKHVLATTGVDKNNPVLLDAFKWVPDPCPAATNTSTGFEVEVTAGTCWLNVHPDYWNVQDFTGWAQSHPGNTATRNPIKEFAEAGLTTLTFPTSHEMTRWQTNKFSFTLAGRLYDRIHYYSLPSGMRTYELNELFGFTPDKITYKESNGALVCGSPNEVANDPFLGGSQGHGAFDTFAGALRTTPNADFARQKQMIWTDIALNAKDQLRQRVAWALSQILVISPDSNDTGEEMTENLVSYYDIFVRNAFGNYRQVLKEVAFSPIMAQMLTFFRSKSTVYTLQAFLKLEFADENFAREVMQLFSTGLNLINIDGTEIKDESGEPIRVYSNDDIMEYARVWTGFNPQPLRGNTETFWQNQIDPLRLSAQEHDPYPKMGLNRKYVGQDAPLCIDLPKRHFLKQGATYRLIGRSASPDLQTADPVQWETAKNAKRLTLSTSGQLFAKLCGASTPESCKFSSKVVLNQDLSCSGAECNVDTLRTVEVANGIFYEYVRPPCVYQAFFNDAKTLVRRQEYSRITCADPRTEMASTGCCSTSGNTWIDEYWGETVTFATAQSRCPQPGKFCTRYPRPSCDPKDPAIGDYCKDAAYFWSSISCKIRVKIDVDQKIAIVHTPNELEGQSVATLVHNSTKTFFRVDWAGGDVDSFIAGCTSFSSCSTTIDNKCVCDVTVSDNQVYSEGASPTSTDILENLQIGAFDPRIYGMNTPSGTNGEVKWYDPSGQMTSDTIFEVTDKIGIRRWRKNMKSTVTLVGTNLSFRNPVHHISMSEPVARDAYSEIDSTIQHYIEHPNTAPFIAIRLAQRFGISNPSPRYVKAIATAFRTGSYSHESITFGTGEYGDLAATVACVLLDREARTILLDADPSHGSLREPLIKLMGLMRSMEFSLNDDAPFVDFDHKLILKMGQMAHALPNVFSFFLPEYKPSGPLAQASLTAPEAQVLTSPRIIDTLNGLSSLVKYGLSKCWGGFSMDYSFETPNCGAYKAGSDTNEGSFGKLSYQPSNTNSARSITDELATLLTAGRLSMESRDMIDQVIESEPNVFLKVIKAQQLILFTPEFHGTNIVRTIGEARPPPPPQPKPSHPYKAVVYLFLDGGMDSFNMLAPHTCTGTNPSGDTLLKQYYTERAGIAINATERSRIIDATNQPCSQFVIHKDLEVVERLYKAGDLSFFANAGVLTRPVNNENYGYLTKTMLFAHNTMAHEAQRIDPYEDAPGSGVLGRMCDIMSTNGFSARPITVGDAAIATVGVPGTSTSPLLVSPYKTNSFNDKPTSESFDPRPFLDQLNNATELHSSLYGETWSSMLQTALNDNNALLDAVSNTQTVNQFPAGDYGQKLKTVSTLITSRQKRGVDRDVFFTSMTGWDHHDALKKNLASKFQDLNAALSSFEKEMKSQGTWNNVALVITSDFGRTLTPNSGEGSDHGWGGHYFIMGGEVSGGKILGEYPSDISSTGPLNVGRGRFIPTTSWESIMNSVVEWMGVPDSEYDYCLPNRLETGSTKLFTMADVFEVPN